MAVVAAKENTFMPGGPGAGRTNTTFGRRKPTMDYSRAVTKILTAECCYCAADSTS